MALRGEVKEVLNAEIAYASSLSDANAKGLRRLRLKACAIEAWEVLQEKKLKGTATLRSVTYEICSAASVAHLRPEQRKKKSEIIAAAVGAESLAVQLAHLIESNASLQMDGDSLRFELEAVAMDRLLRGPSFTEGRFHSVVESRLDELQARDYPAHKGMTTAQALRLIGRSYGWD